MQVYYYGSLRQEQRDLSISRLQNPQGGYATEELVRRSTEGIAKKVDNQVIEAPAAMVSGENIVANVEDDIEMTVRSSAQTHSKVFGVIAPEFRDADTWMKKISEMRLYQVSAESGPLEEAGGSD